jgi:hypothetical protein
VAVFPPLFDRIFCHHSAPKGFYTKIRTCPRLSCEVTPCSKP